MSKSQKNTDTVFGHDHGQPTDEYTLKEAINEVYLVNYKVHSRSTNLLSEGIDREKLSPTEKQHYDEVFGRNAKDEDDEFATKHLT